METFLKKHLKGFVKTLFISFVLLSIFHGSPFARASFPVQLPELQEGLPLIQADEVHQLGYTGKGVGVAVIDIFEPNANDPCKSVHGVWIEGLLHGVAPDANIKRFNVSTVRGSSDKTCFIMDYRDINRSLEEILERHETLGIHVVNLSWGGGKHFRPCSNERSQTSHLIRSLVKKGISVISASGNEGYDDALIWPACLPEVISVGATFDYESDTPERSASCVKQPVIDDVTCYSNTAPYLDVLAPGSRASVNESLSGLGTSASTAYVSGVIALMLQAKPSLSPDQVKEYLKDGGKLVKDPRNGLNFPRVDALQTLNAILPKAPLVSYDNVRKGDVNLDGSVDWSDISKLMATFENLTSLNDIQNFAADVAAPCDQSPTPEDLHHLRMMVTGNLESQCKAADTSLDQASEPLFLQSIQTKFFINWLEFTVYGSGIDFTQLTVYALSGERLFDSGMNIHPSLQWDMLDQQGRRVPNGVYLMVIQAHGGNGEKISKMKKLAIIQ